MLMQLLVAKSGHSMIRQEEEQRGYLSLDVILADLTFPILLHFALDLFID